MSVVAGTAVDGECAFLTYDDVEAALVEAWQLWRRSPGGGRWPFAGDGPWHLATGDVRAGDYDARGGDGASSDVAVRPMPLSRGEVSERDVASEWLSMIPDEGDRRIVCLAIAELARGAKRVPWRKLLAPMGRAHGADALRMRYTRAIGRLAMAVNAG
ncbi:hypothetical protein FSZ31_04320 [Sphingorhabdus soli]|uniref:DUF2285 domain-containing protein n=1 Tax=Flavisphingopyxis soli TaxID=2601267 RepID=A0A5C6UL72_9SPHN|nr:hypothetical protein [Sphingorhabdus soli]TXC73952.1 hypothetical protein FSZ31_04320 [Sphingorhabdus soli]